MGAAQPWALLAGHARPGARCQLAAGRLLGQPRDAELLSRGCFRVGPRRRSAQAAVHRGSVRVHTRRAARLHARPGLELRGVPRPPRPESGLPAAPPPRCPRRPGPGRGRVRGACLGTSGGEGEGAGVAPPPGRAVTAGLPAPRAQATSGSACPRQPQRLGIPHTRTGIRMGPETAKPRRDAFLVAPDRLHLRPGPRGALGSPTRPHFQVRGCAGRKKPLESVCWKRL